MSQIHKVVFNPNPMQKRFIESRAKADLFCSRMGEGKTVALAWSTLHHTRHNPGANCALIRDTWENMQATTLKTFLEWFPPGIFGTFNQTRRLFTWASGVADGTVEFLGMDDPADASKLMSRELAMFGIDEPAPATASGGVDEMIFDIALSRLRQGGMKFYCAKLAENNPDETHWTYRRFVDPGTEGFKLWQPDAPENEKNLPQQYYAELRRVWHHRPDLVRRFIAGEFGFQQEGKAVIPQWQDRHHLASGLKPMPGRELVLLWDFGHNPTCIITQITPMGHWLVLHSMVGDGIGVEELIYERVKPLLTTEYGKYKYWHTGDPQGNQREQTSIHRSAVKFIRKELGGRWRPGPVRLHQRIEPLRAVCSRLVGGVGLLQVDRGNAREVFQALRGGWHFRVARTGVVSGEPVKDMHSHPGDAMSYGAAVLFPVGKPRLMVKPGTTVVANAPDYSEDVGTGTTKPTGPLTFERPGLIIPKHGDKLGG